MEDYEHREREWLKEKEKMSKELQTLNQESVFKMDDGISSDGKKLIDAGWTIAKLCYFPPRKSVFLICVNLHKFVHYLP